MPSPAADWYTVIVSRSIAFAKSKSMPATSFPISAVISEHCRSVAAQYWPAMPYWLYGVATGLPAAAGGLISELTPEVADSGCGTPGWHRLLIPPMIPDCPSEQNPSKPPMSPMPGTEHGPPADGCAADSVRAVLGGAVFESGVAVPSGMPVPRACMVLAAPAPDALPLSPGWWTWCAAPRS